ncbi:MAG TPA: hypothetical protein VFW78_11170 [Bacteroidia bacterium]|nr:hypothetical protein [Bacteroidia bacterium]
MDNIKKSLEKATAEAMANGTLNVLKKEYPQFSWTGKITYDFDSKRFSFIGFSKEEQEIINKIDFK